MRWEERRREKWRKAEKGKRRGEEKTREAEPEAEYEPRSRREKARQFPNEPWFLSFIGKRQWDQGDHAERSRCRAARLPDGATGANKLQATRMERDFPGNETKTSWTEYEKHKHASLSLSLLFLLHSFLSLSLLFAPFFSFSFSSPFQTFTVIFVSSLAMGVFFCGPPLLSKQLYKHCSKFSTGKAGDTQFKFKKENF